MASPEAYRRQDQHGQRWNEPAAAEQSWRRSQKSNERQQGEREWQRNESTEDIYASPRAVLPMHRNRPLPSVVPVQERHVRQLRQAGPYSLGLHGSCCYTDQSHDEHLPLLWDRRAQKSGAPTCGTHLLNMQEAWPPGEILSLQGQGPEEHGGQGRGEGEPCGQLMPDLVLCHLRAGWQTALPGGQAQRVSKMPQNQAGQEACNDCQRNHSGTEEGPAGTGQVDCGTSIRRQRCGSNVEGGQGTTGSNQPTRTNDHPTVRESRRRRKRKRSRRRSTS